MPAWLGIALGYVWYLAAVALVVRRFTGIRTGLIIVAAVETVLAAGLVAGRAELPPLARVWLPLPVLLAGYWLSGLFFVQPMPGIERRLLDMDDRLLSTLALQGWQRRHPMVERFFELAYLLVYVVVPAGAAVVALTGGPDDIERFWAIVLLAAFACYGALPWVQTRPPRALGSHRDAASALRHLNLAILAHGSIQANTLPSGHAASAVAVALAVAHMAPPAAGALFLVVAAIVTAATVAGRYHFMLDAALGVAVGAAAFALIILTDWSGS